MQRVSLPLKKTHCDMSSEGCMCCPSSQIADSKGRLAHLFYINLSPPADYTVMAVWRALSYKKVHQMVTGYHTNQITQQNSLQRAGGP
jgi:hypothetical protein